MLCAGFWQLGNFLATGTGRQGWKEAMHPQPIIIPPDGGLEITLVCLMRLTDHTGGGGSSVRWGSMKLPQWELGSGSELVDRALWAPLQHILQMCLHELQPLLCVHMILMSVWAQVVSSCCFPFSWCPVFARNVIML